MAKGFLSFMRHSPHHPTASTKRGALEILLQNLSCPLPSKPLLWPESLRLVNAVSSTCSEIWSSASRFCTLPKSRWSLLHAAVPQPIPLSSLLPVSTQEAEDKSRPPCLRPLLSPLHSLSKSHIRWLPPAGPNTTFHKCLPPFQPAVLSPHSGF